MLLKKQTVWLLTMLSLVIVLSVYYVTTPQEKQNQMATTVEKEDKSKAQDNVATEDGVESKTEESITTGGDETFETLRMEVTDERNKLVEELVVLMGNTELTAKERVEAQTTIKDIQQLNEKEAMLESLIVSMDYDAALVRADDQNIRVTVKAPELSDTAANDIIRLVSKELPEAQNITVELQPAK